MGKMAVRTEVTAAEFAQSYSAQARNSGVPRPSRASSPGRGGRVSPGTRRGYAERAHLATTEFYAFGADAAWWRPSPPPRSEERRVGKECRSRWSTYHEK